MRARTSYNLRSYAAAFLTACALSLLFSPPTLPTRDVVGASVGTRNPAELTGKLSKYLGEGTFGIAARDLQTGDSYGLDEHRVFDGGSTMKLVMLAYLYHEASAGQIDLNQTTTVTQADVQDYGSGSLRYAAMPQELSYRELARLIAKQSDNTAAHVLGKKFEQDKVQAFANNNGMTATSLDNHSTTAADMLDLMEKLYRGELAGRQLSDELLGLMNGTDFEDRIPAKLPPGATVQHKTGDALDGGMHDVGIVDYQGRTYSVAIYSYAVPYQLLPDISREIFDYMTG